MQEICQMEENKLSYIIIGLCIKIHNKLGPGLLESAYEECLGYELTKIGLNYTRQEIVPITYEEIKLEHGYRADIIVEKKVIIEIKSVENIMPIHSAQLLTYLKLKKVKLGLLINFNSPSMREGIKRIVNKL